MSSRKTRLKWLIAELIGGLISPERLESCRYALNLRNDMSLVEKVIRAAARFRASHDKRYNDLQEYHWQYWESFRGRKFHEHTEKTFSTNLERHFKRTIDQIDDYINLHPGHFNSVCEIGTGNGMLLTYFALRFPQLARLVGIDLNSEQVNKNQQLYKDPRVSFVCSPAQRWIPSNGNPNCIFLTNGGVFEYFSQNLLESLLGFISTKLHPAAVAIFEPIARDYDLNSEESSRPFGNELSFSHNYPRLFRKVGLNIISSEETHFSGLRFIRLLSVSSMKS